jgi:VWFA-related protein
VVSLEAVVLDSNARPVTSLKREDFAVFEDGEPKEIQNFSSVESPYSILLLFQNTLNVFSQRPFMADASNRFLDTLRPQDRVSVYTMEITMRRILDWRNAQSGKRQEVKVGPPGGLLNLYDAIEEVFGKFGGVAGRKGIVVLTNGRDDELYRETFRKGRVPATTENSPFRKALKKVRERGIPLYIVALNTDRSLMTAAPTQPAPPTPSGGPTLRRPGDSIVSSAPDEYAFLKAVAEAPPDGRGFFIRRPKDASPTVADDFLVEVRSRMEQLAESSGGRIYFPKDLDEVVPLYEQIGRELGTSYSIGYAPGAAAGIGTHTIEVRVANPELKVIQSRQTYTIR